MLCGQTHTFIILNLYLESAIVSTFAPMKTSSISQVLEIREEAECSLEIHVHVPRPILP